MRRGAGILLQCAPFPPRGGGIHAPGTQARSFRGLVSLTPLQPCRSRSGSGISTETRIRAGSRSAFPQTYCCCPACSDGRPRSRRKRRFQFSPNDLPTETSTVVCAGKCPGPSPSRRSEEHTSELQSRENLVCRLLLEKKK